MKFTPERLNIRDEKMKPFIDPEEIWSLLRSVKPDKQRVREIISRSLEKNRLTLEETACLVNVKDPDLINEIKDGARHLKEKIYGNRIVLFAPLYVGNMCINDCRYCGFRVSNRSAQRITLSDDQVCSEVDALEESGHKRLILVFGEHPVYSPDFIAATVRKVYSVKRGNGEIRRVNINAAPFGVEGFRTIGGSGIGTYQIFQETYHPEAYKWYHPAGKKAGYNWRLTALDRAQEANIDDVGIGALFGLYDWRFEVMGLVRHTNHLEACYNVGPHTISFPRLKDASTMKIEGKYLVSDDEFSRLVAILRLAVPYTGLILTAREDDTLRKEVLKYGISQIDGGTRIEIGAYSATGGNNQDLNREQFRISDERSLSEVIDDLLDDGFVPSFCTACYRLGRTGEHFMEFSVPGFIKRYCTPNAILTLAEYMSDYAGTELADKGWKVIEKSLLGLEAGTRSETVSRLAKIREGERDIYF